MKELNEILKKVESGLVQFIWLYFENDVWEEGTVLVAKWGGWEMLEIKKSWLIVYGLNDHDFPIKWMFRLRRSEGVSGWFPISPSSALRAPSPSREKVFLRFWKQWILQLRVNPACRMTWGWGESGRRTVYLSIPLPKGAKRSALVQYSAHESIKTHCWWYQSIISACSVNSYFKQHQHQYADNKINAQSINSQCTEHLQAIHKASASNECKINISALSININA